MCLIANGVIDLGRFNFISENVKNLKSKKKNFNNITKPSTISLQNKTIFREQIFNFNSVQGHSPTDNSRNN